MHVFLNRKEAKGGGREEKWRDREGRRVRETRMKEKGDGK